MGVVSGPVFRSIRLKTCVCRAGGVEVWEAGEGQRQSSSTLLSEVMQRTIKSARRLRGQAARSHTHTHTCTHTNAHTRTRTRERAGGGHGKALFEREIRSNYAAQMDGPPHQP